MFECLNSYFNCNECNRWARSSTQNYTCIVFDNFLLKIVCFILPPTCNYCQLENSVEYWPLGYWVWFYPSMDICSPSIALIQVNCTLQSRLWNNESLNCVYLNIGRHKTITNYIATLNSNKAVGIFLFVK